MHNSTCYMYIYMYMSLVCWLYGLIDTLTQTTKNEGWGIKEDQIPSSSHSLLQTMGSQMHLYFDWLGIFADELLSLPSKDNQPPTCNIARLSFDLMISGSLRIHMHIYWVLMDFQSIASLNLVRFSSFNLVACKQNKCIIDIVYMIICACTWLSELCAQIWRWDVSTYPSSRLLVYLYTL